MRDVAHMDRAEIAVGDVETDGERVLDIVLTRDEARAGRVRPAGAAQRPVLDRFAVRGDDVDVEPAHRDLVARLEHGVLSLGVERRIDLGEELVGGFGRLLVRTVIHEFADRDALLELGHPAVMIAVPVRDDQAVDLGETGILRGGIDALGIAHRAVGVAGVDQERFTGRVHEQRRVAAFDVDDIDVQRRAGAPAHRRKRRSGKGKRCRATGLCGALYPPDDDWALRPRSDGKFTRRLADQQVGCTATCGRN